MSRWWWPAFLAIAALAGIVWYLQQANQILSDASVVTGYSLFSIIVLQLLFRARKGLSVIPLGSASAWYRWHVVAGLLAIALYALHIDGLWPNAGYERWLAALLYLVTLSGLLGLGLQNLLPQRLTENGDETLYERIPAAVAEIRGEAESLLLKSTRTDAVDTLAQHYIQRLDWYFRRPRFLLSHLLGGRKAQHWLQMQFDFLDQYLQNNELIHSARLRALADKKHLLDFQYTAQRVLKVWLLMHVPLSAGLAVMVLWHLLIVHIYVI